MGGRGDSLDNGNGGRSVDIRSKTDVWSYRHNKNNEQFVDEINMGVRKIQNDFPDVMDTVSTVTAAELGPKDKDSVLGFYGDNGLSLNTNYTDVNKMNAVYDRAVASKYHPARGNLTGTQAVALHEMGHALTDHLAPKLGHKPGQIDEAATDIVKRAYRKSGAKGGNKRWAGTISRYAQSSYAEAIAEAVADVYCNGSNAASASKYIVDEMKRSYNM